MTILAENPPASALFVLIGAVFISSSISWALNWARRRLAARAIGDLVLNLRLDAFRAAAAHDLSFYDEFKTGRIVSRVTSDTQDFAQVITLVTDLASQILSVTILSVILIAINWQLTLMVIAFTPVVMMVALSFRGLARRVTRQGNRAMANVNASIRETIAGISIAKNFRQERTIYNEFTQVNAQSYQINLRRGFVMANIFPVLNGLAGVGTAMVVYFGGFIAGSGGISVGTWYLFINSMEKYWFPVTNLAAFLESVSGGVGGSRTSLRAD